MQLYGNTYLLVMNVFGFETSKTISNSVSSTLFFIVALLKLGLTQTFRILVTVTDTNAD